MLPCEVLQNDRLAILVPETLECFVLDEAVQPYQNLQLVVACLNKEAAFSRWKSSLNSVSAKRTGSSALQEPNCSGTLGNFSFGIFPKNIFEP
jgi:hypothetical protein